jgi:hypothetical protein
MKCSQVLPTFVVLEMGKAFAPMMIWPPQIID